MEFEIVATSTFGVEAVLKKEIKDLGFKITDSRNGRITFLGDERDLVKANIWLRTADRVYLKLSEFKALSFEELFQSSKQIEWERYLPEDANFVVIGTSARSTLHSVPACQSIIEKAIITRLSSYYGVDWFSKSGNKYTVRFSFQNDNCLICLDSSGEALHKRGYRVKDVPAPIKETMAAALIKLSYFDKTKVLLDPMCGSGTIAIEAAMIAKNIAPGLGRDFDAMNWSIIPASLWKEEKKAAFESIVYDDSFHIYASDIDQRTVDFARENAIEAGVDDIIKFSVKDVSNVKINKFENIIDDDGQVKAGSLITNPPYGQRIGEKEAIEEIYKALKRIRIENPSWEINLITPDKAFERKFGKAADKRRKLYNGNIESCYYQYFAKSDTQDKTVSKSKKESFARNRFRNDEVTDEERAQELLRR